MSWQERNQKNKAVVWDYWQRMNHALPREVESVLKRAYHKDIDWHGFHPINHVKGLDGAISRFWEPLQQSFPDLHRTPHILIGGEMDGEDWVSGYGYFSGTFVHDWLGIPATGQKTHINFGQFCVMRDEKIVESYVILDVLSVMKQAGFQVLPPALGQEGGKILKPLGNDGILLAEQDELESRKSLQLVAAMGAGHHRYSRPRDGTDMSSMEHEYYWHPDFHWMGPTGIGSTHTTEEFKDFHQRPWLIGFGDRGVEDPNGRLMGMYGEGQYAALGIWDYKFSRHNGEYQGVPATNKLISLRDFDWYKRDGDRLIQNWVPIDMVDLFLQFDIDLFDRMHRQHELRKRGINWWDLPVDKIAGSRTADSLRKV